MMSERLAKSGRQLPAAASFTCMLFFVMEFLFGYNGYNGG